MFIGIMLLGTGLGFVLVPTLPDAQLCVSITAKDSNENKSTVSALWMASYALATAIGSPVVGLLYEKYGFLPVMYWYAVVAAVMALLSFIFALVTR